MDPFTTVSLPIRIFAFWLLTRRSATFLSAEKCNEKAKHNTDLKEAEETDSTLYKTLDAGLSKDMIWALSWKIVYRKRSPAVIKPHMFFMDGIWRASDTLLSSELARGSCVMTLTWGLWSQPPSFVQTYRKLTSERCRVFMLSANGFYCDALELPRQKMSTVGESRRYFWSWL